MPEGHTIHKIAKDHSKLLVGRPIGVSSPQGRFAESAMRIDGAFLNRIEPRGKHLFYEWDSGEVGHVHLGLFGKFRVQVGPTLNDPIGEVRMRLTTETETAEIVTIDLSGPTICSLDAPDVRISILARLGPDPLRRNSKPDRMIDKIRASDRGIGDLIMDQSVVAGVGNVYRAEALFVLGIHPLKPGREFEVDELEALWETIRTMLRRGVSDGRIVTVSRDEVGIGRGRPIPREEATYAYKRDHCLKCGDEIRRIEIANRICYFCPTHQTR